MIKNTARIASKNAVFAVFFFPFCFPSKISGLTIALINFIGIIEEKY